MKKRDPSIECLRIFLMLGICVLHVKTMVVHDYESILTHLLMACVPGFVFISGWCGLVFSWGKVARLMILAMFCVSISIGLGFITDDVLSMSEWGYRVMSDFKHCWFLHAYIVLMIVAPLINLAVDKRSFKDLMPLLFLAFGWSFAHEVAERYTPETAGLGAYTGLTLIGVYTLARMMRVWVSDGYISVRNLVVLLLVCGVVVAVGCGFECYNSLPCASLAGCVFLLFRKISVPKRVAKVICIVSPSVFSVYLLHTNCVGFKYMARLYNCLDNSVIVTAFVVFALCLCIDFIRRLLFLLALRILRYSHA